MTAAELYEIVRQPWWDGVRPEGIQWKPDNNGETYFRVDDWFRIDTDHAIMLHEAAAYMARCVEAVRQCAEERGGA